MTDATVLVSTHHFVSCSCKYMYCSLGKMFVRACVCARSQKSHVASVDLPCLVVTHRADHCAVIMGQLERVSYRSVLTHHRELLVSRLRSIQCIVDNLSASGFFCQEEAEIVLQAVTKTDQVRTLRLGISSRVGNRLPTLDDISGLVRKISCDSLAGAQNLGAGPMQRGGGV